MSVVIATRNRRDQVLPMVQRLRALPERPPVIVVDDGSTDGTAEALMLGGVGMAAAEAAALGGGGIPAAAEAAAAGVTVVRHHRSTGPAVARNSGVRAATTPYVAFSDDDSWWAAGALGAAARLFDAHPGLGLVAGRILVGPEERLDPTCAAMAASPLPSGRVGPRILGFVACGAVVRRSAFLEVGGFPAGYPVGGEEQPLALALAGSGWDLVYRDDIVAHHHPGRGPREPGRRERNVIRNDLWTAWCYRRPVGALLETLTLLRGADTAAKRAGVADALRELPAALRLRRPIPPGLEAHRRLLDHRG